MINLRHGKERGVQSRSSDAIKSMLSIALSERKTLETEAKRAGGCDICVQPAQGLDCKGDQKMIR